MKNTILVTIIALLAMSICNSQRIEQHELSGKHRYVDQQGRRMKMGDLVNAMEGNREALNLIKGARIDRNFSSVMGFAGGGLMGWSLGTAIGGGDANWTLAGVGAGLIGLSIPFSSNAKKNTKRAVQTYNASLGTTSFIEHKPQLKFIANGNGIGMSLGF
ncbi:MAG: hypothetical protein AAGC45_06635 [Bacteroidota bacterium]